MFKKIKNKWNNRGIRTTLITYFSLIAMIPVVIMGVIAYNQSAHALEQEVGNKVKDFASVHMEKLDRIMYERSRDMQLLANELSNMEINNIKQNKLTDFLDNQVNQMVYFASLSFSDQNGDIVGFSSNLTAEYQPNQQPTIQSSEDMVYSDVYYSSELDKHVIAITADVMKNQNKIGTVEGTFDITYIWEDINSISTDTMVVELINQNGEKVADTVASASVTDEETKESMFQTTTEMLERLEGVKAGDASYYSGKDNNNQDAIIGYAKSEGYLDYPGFNWTLVVTEPTSIALSSIASIRNVISVIALSTLVGVIIVSILLAKMIAKPLIQLKNKARTIAEGNLTDKVAIRGRGEVRQLSQAMNQMTDHLREAISYTKKASNRINEQSNALKDICYNLKDGSEQLTSTTQEMAAGADEQATSSAQIATAGKSFDNKVKQVKKNADELKISSQEVSESAIKGNRQVNHTMEQMDTINTNVKNAVDNVKELEKQSKAVSELTSVINKITEQTNLLALNAAIESARAGESGKGFSVVANEIKKLAEQVSVSAIDIAQVMSKMQQESNRLQQSLKHTYEQADKGVQDIKESASYFSTIMNEVEGMNNHITLVAENLELIELNSNEMNKGMEQIASVSQENAANIEETTAAIQQQKDAVDYLTNQSNILEDLSAELKNIITKFTID
ncbi:Methyl-accepting chemotaxis protein McpC [Paraliobacillus sp. PM-2]|uniref:methyl-accepting chemotaxis protein n=1 Tax=Paraliobacillus sp. PM-2 TaxID=1462524 RepID=UPI00061C936A|nr:methyl-accepting chemotaxis protein [Paraliobacillus sp. PM-2]CQR46765.1 Methyl-accepting chemotaxis protein McpC [Paraliobacillus sp. PM-2]